MRLTESCSESRMRSGTSRGVPKWSRGEDLYIGSPISAIGKVSGVTSIVPGPPGGATYPGGPHGLKWEGNQPLVGWCAPPGPPSAPRVGNPRGGGASTCLGGASFPPGRRPPWRLDLLGLAPPLGGLYKEGGGRAAAPMLLAPPSPSATPLPPADAW